MIPLALAAALLLGVVLGSRGALRLGRSLRGPWRPGAGVGAALALLAGLALLARGEWVVGLPLLVAGAVLATAARRRTRRPTAAAAAPPTQGLGRREAASVLGVTEDAPAAEIEAAHRRLMRRAHPDLGGTAGLAAQLNAARDALLRKG